MFVGITIAWLPRKQLRLSEEAVFVARSISLLLLYHVVIMIIGVPLARYSVSLRPFMYIMAMLPIALAFSRYLTPPRVASDVRTEQHRGRKMRQKKQR
jgi:hypothetical protein